jgi:Flp pilus assembly protein TadD
MEAALGLAKSLLTLKRYAEVVPEMQRVIQLDPINPQPHFHLSQAFLGLGDKEKAQQETETFRQLNQQRMLRRDHEGGRELPAK